MKEFIVEIYEEITGEKSVIEADNYKEIKDKTINLAGCNFVTVKTKYGTIADKFYVENLG